jgi:uncharacterized membrane protein (UPF0136 family)
MDITTWVGLIVVYALLVAAGGVFGYVKTRSKVSLISGLVSGLVLAIAAKITSTFPIGGLVLAGLIALILVIVFAIRFAKTRAFMPAGLMTILSAIAAIAFWAGSSTFFGR